MADFYRLPNEMISEIWGYVHEPRDVESFALVSKLIYALGRRPVAEHKALKKENACFDTDEDHAFTLLKDVLLRPRIALYVTHVSVGGDETRRWDYPLYTDDVAAMITEAVQKTDILSSEVVSYSIEDFLTGDEDSTLALLFLLLPNLSTITLDIQRGGDPELYFKTIQRIAEAQQTKFLMHLKTVNIKFSYPIIWTPPGTRLWCDSLIGSEYFQELARLPLAQSMNIIVPDVLDLHEVIRSQCCFWPESSRITEWTFTCSNTPLFGTRFQLSKRFRELVKFSCVEGGEKGYGFDAFWRSDPPLADAKDSLESLKILSFLRGKNKLLGSLQGFTALKELEIELSLLICYDRDELLESLPASLEKLHLHTRKGHLEALPDIVKCIMEARSQLLPRLSVLQIEVERKSATKHLIREEMESMKEGCREGGIELGLIGF